MSNKYIDIKGVYDNRCIFTIAELTMKIAAIGIYPTITGTMKFIQFDEEPLYNNRIHYNDTIPLFDVYIMSSDECQTKLSSVELLYSDYFPSLHKVTSDRIVCGELYYYTAASLSTINLNDKEKNEYSKKGWSFL